MGLAVLAVICLPFPVIAALNDTGWALPTFLLVFFGIPAHRAGEMLVIETRIYEHGLVSRSLPGPPVFVIPFFTVDPDTIEITGRWKRGPDDPLVDSRKRLTPWNAHTIWFTGLAARYARRLAKGKLAWDSVGKDFVQRRGRDVFEPQTAGRWATNFRHPEHYRQVLEDAVRASQRDRPYDPSAGRPSSDRPGTRGNSGYREEQCQIVA